MIELSLTWWRTATRVGDATVVSVRTTFDEGAFAEQADSICDALTVAGYHQELLILAIDSMLCLSAKVACDKPQRRHDRQAMLYQLEEWIPWAAEDFVGDFVNSEGPTLAVAVRVEPLRQLLLALASKDVSIVSIAPTAMLAAMEHLNRYGSPDHHVVLWQNQNSFDLLRLDCQQITDWNWLPADSELLHQTLAHQVVQANGPISLQTYSLDEQAVARIDELGLERHAKEDSESLDRAEAAFEFAARILGGRAESPIELRQSALGSSDRRFAIRRHVRALQFAAAALAITAALALLYRAHRYDVYAADSAADEIRVFQELFPNRQVPAGVRSRLESELSQVKGIRGEAKDLSTTYPVLPVLTPFLAALPADLRFRILELRIEDGQIYLDGEAREHGDAVTIAGLLRKCGFDVAAPRSQRLEGKKVSFRITGRFAGPNATAQHGPST